MTVRVTRRSLIAGTAMAPLLIRRAFAQAPGTWPSRPVRIIVAWAPGGAVDTVARRMAQKLAEQLGQPFVVENKAGATGTIGAAEAARAAPDGHTLLALDNTYAMLPFLLQRLPFDHATAFAPVSVSAFSPVLLAVGSRTPYRSLQELIAAARREPEKITYGTGGIGSAPHFATEAFQQAAGIKLYHVPYRGAGEAVTAALGGQVDMVMISLGSALGSIQGGLLRPLAISRESRIAAMPELPTFAEAGMPGFGVVNWSGLAAPRGTPAAIIGRLQAEMARALATPDMQAFLASLGAEPGGMPPEAMAALISRETELWRGVAARAEIQPQ